NQDCVFAITDSAATIFAGLGARMPRVGNQHPFTAPYECLATSDGYVVVGTASNKLFRKLVAAIGRPELAGDPRFKQHRARAANRLEINAIVADWARAKSCAEVLAVLGPAGADVPCARVASPEEGIHDPQLVARGMLERHAHPTLGEVLFHGNPLRFSGLAPRLRPLAPELGEANDEVYGALGLGPDERRALAEKGVI
ncbi:MAG: CoA transferase, partial [Myxococcota bacterium]